MDEERKILEFLECYDLRKETLARSIDASPERVLSELRYLSGNNPELFTRSIIELIITSFPLQPRTSFTILHELASRQAENRNYLLKAFIQQADAFPVDALDATYYLAHNDRELVNPDLVTMVKKHIDADPRRTFDVYQVLVVKRPEFVDEFMIQQVLERVEVVPIIAFHFLRLVAERIPSLTPLCTLGLFECIIQEKQYVLKDEMIQSIYGIAGLSHVMTSLEQELKKPFVTGTKQARALMALIFGQKLRAQQSVLLNALDFAVHWQWIWDFLEFLLDITSQKVISTGPAEKFLEGAYRLSYLLTPYDFEKIFALNLDVQQAKPVVFDHPVTFLNTSKVAVLAGKALLLANNLHQPLEFTPIQAFQNQQQDLEREIDSMTTLLSKEEIDAARRAHLQKRLENMKQRMEQMRSTETSPREERKLEERLFSFLTERIIEIVNQAISDLKVVAVQKTAKRLLGYEADLWKVDEKIYPALFLLEKLGPGNDFTYLKRLIEDKLQSRGHDWLWKEPPVLRWRGQVLQTSPNIQIERWRAPFKKSYSHRLKDAREEKRRRVQLEINQTRLLFEKFNDANLKLPENPTLDDLERMIAKIPSDANITVKEEIQVNLKRVKRINEAPISDYEGIIEIEVETDPFQYLFMGDYGFASCLSMQGSNFWGAVSNAIDVDKVVLWAREARGNIVGRRLIALVPGGILSYRTYANRHGLALDRFFRDFIASYAAHCNTIQIHAGTPGPLLSDRWYDDQPI